MSVGYEYEDFSGHPWCSDPARDEAVRAAEDGRIGPLPTLEEAIASITNHGAPPGARVSDSPCAGRADTGANTAGAGLRTERVTLEVTHRHEISAECWDWRRIVDLEPDESARVVEECCLDRINMGEVIRERDAAIRERDEAKARLSTCLAGSDVMWSRLLAVGGERDSWKILAEKSNARADSLTARVAELESAPAASGAANSPESPESSEPDAWGVRMKSGRYKGFLFDSEETAQKCAELITDDTVPLFASPPPARGWLTEDEREAVADAAETLAMRGCGSERRSKILKSLLARSTPPEVVLPPMPDCSPMADYGAAWSDCLSAVREALRRAGVNMQQPLPPEVEGNG